MVDNFAGMIDDYDGVSKETLQAIKRTIQKQVKPAKVMKVRAERHEEDESYYIMLYVIFERFDTRDNMPEFEKLIPLWTLVNPILEKAGHPRSPVFRFWSQDGDFGEA